MAETNTLKTTARAMVAPGKGILAADESTPSIEKKFTKINIPNTEDNRRAYREMFFTTPGIGDYISGVIMYDETFRQSTQDGTPFLKILKDAGILLGIKVDLGTMDMPGSLVEKITKGREGLPARLKEYAQMGANFAKWRAVITIAGSAPTDANIRQNAKDLAGYAKACQEAGIVPIVEPEVLMGGEHTMEICATVTERVLRAVFEELKAAGVMLEGMILKPNMIVPGEKCPIKKTTAEIAEATVTVLKKVVPGAVAGIAFLSGGQSEIDSTDILNAVNERGPFPWGVTFSFGRALQDSALAKWAGKPENILDAQMAFLWRAQMNGLASRGVYGREMETV